MYTVYGIPNCDTIKKALKWLDKNKIAYRFHDYKKEGITAGKLQSWSRQVGWEVLLNKKGTTWRNLDPEMQKKVTNEKAAIQLMTTATSSIKRPVIELGETVVMTGFDEPAYHQTFL